MTAAELLFLSITLVDTFSELLAQPLSTGGSVLLNMNVDAAGAALIFLPKRALKEPAGLLLACNISESV